YAILARVAAGVLFEQRAAVRLAAVVDPTRDVAFALCIDHVLVVQREQERVAAVAGVRVQTVGLCVGQALAAVFDEFGPGWNVDEGENAVAVDRRAACGDAFWH